jgi:hypothetical protein
MPIKIFQAGGAREIDRLQGEIDGWFAQGHEEKVRQISTAMATVGERTEFFQHFVVTIWYRDS